MTGTFFALAFLSAVNPKLLGVDLLLIDNERPRRMFASFLLGGIGMALTVGLLDVFVVRADALSTQGSASAGLDLVVGVPLVIVGVLLATGRLHGRKREPVPAAPGGEQPTKKEGWAQRVLRDPRPGLAFALGALCGTPGALYISALHDLITGNWSTARQTVTVMVFVVIEFCLVIIPFAFLEFRPEGTARQLRRAQDWLTTHARQLTAGVAIFAGTYMAISGLVRLL
ncbi:MAG TPA: GAP family protein [Streptosporangiaceae bacterium]